jgi:hypothetical protein
MHPHAQPDCLGDEELQGPENVSCSVQMALFRCKEKEEISGVTANEVTLKHVGLQETAEKNLLQLLVA